jgi:MFS family permease
VIFSIYTASFSCIRRTEEIKGETPFSTSSSVLPFSSTLELTLPSFYRSETWLVTSSLRQSLSSLFRSQVGALAAGPVTDRWGRRFGMFFGRTLSPLIVSRALSLSLTSACLALRLLHHCDRIYCHHHFARQGPICTSPSPCVSARTPLTSLPVQIAGRFILGFGIASVTTACPS